MNIFLFTIDKNTRKINNYLLKKGLDVNIRSSNGTSPLLKAIIMKEDQILENIIANGADLYVKDIHGISALHNAVMRNNIFAAKLLMHKGVRFSFKEYRTGKAEEVTSWEKVSRKMKITIAEELR